MSDLLHRARGHSSITSSKRWVGGVRKWQFLMIYSTVNHQRVVWVGLKKPKTWWRNTWMPPNAPMGSICNTRTTTVNKLDQLALTRLSAVAHQSAPLRGTPFIWRTPRGASSVPTSHSRYEYSECAPNLWHVTSILVCRIFDVVHVYYLLKTKLHKST